MGALPLRGLRLRREHRARAFPPAPDNWKAERCAPSAIPGVGEWHGRFPKQDAIEAGYALVDGGPRLERAA
jgi:hypothetical protein